MQKILQGAVLRGGNSRCFQSLNYCYAKDDKQVWTSGGMVKNVDIETFQVCDSGISKVFESNTMVQEFSDGKMRESIILIPYGYAKDKNHVYYENFCGKTKIVKKANPHSFQSLDNGLYGFDDRYVFYEQFVIPKANPEYWQLVDSQKSIAYSKDDKSVFFLNQKIEGADTKTFELYGVKQKYSVYDDEKACQVEKQYYIYYGKDKQNKYDGINII